MKEYKRGIIVIIFIMVSFLSMATGVSAMSLQVRGGTTMGGDLKGGNVGADLFIYEGKSFDLFAGYDSISAYKGFFKHNPPPPNQQKVTYNINAASLGLRYKFQTSSSWKPYLSLGVAMTKTTKFTFEQNNMSLFESPKSESQIGARLGFGVDVGISENWSLGLEAFVYSNIQMYEETYPPINTLTNAALGFLNLGLRYHF